MRKTLVAANWKMHGSSAMTTNLLTALTGSLSQSSADVLICPPFPYLAAAAALLEGSRVGIGAQNLHAAEQGAYTGEVSGAMLKDVGCSHVLIGHSERRQLFAESDDAVAAKFAAAQREGLIPVLCVGETLDERKSGDTIGVVSRQLAAITDEYGLDSLNSAVVAYEPVWAIGTGETATPEQAQEVHAALRAQLPERIARELRILYGGSVNADNAAALFAQPDIDGGLIGGASLSEEKFAAIITAAR